MNQVLQKAPKPLVLLGVVTSTKMDKTASVRVHRTVVDPKIGKPRRQHKSYHVHDEHNVLKEGDQVEIQEISPRSKTKYFVLKRVISSAGSA